MARYCRLNFITIQKGELKSDYYYSWEISIFHIKSKNKKVLSIKPILSDEIKAYSSKENAVNAAKKIAKEFDLIITGGKDAN